MPVESIAKVASGLPAGARLAPRQASALTGLEVIEALVKSLTEGLVALNVPQKELLAFAAHVRQTLEGRSLLYAEHLTYPTVTWTWRICWGPGVHTLDDRCGALLELSLGRPSIRLEFGPTEWAKGTKTHQVHQAPSRYPDLLRERWFGGTKVDVIMPDGLRQTILLTKAAPVEETPIESSPVPESSPIELPQAELLARPPAEPSAPPSTLAPAKPGVRIKTK